MIRLIVFKHYSREKIHLHQFNYKLTVIKEGQEELDLRNAVVKD